MRVGVHLRDRDGLWFEALLPGMIRPGDWTTYALDISGVNSAGLRAVNHKKAWTSYTRQRLTEIGLHVYTTHPSWKPTPKDPVLQLTARFDNIRAVVMHPSLQPESKPVITLVVPEPGTRNPEPRLFRGDLWECHVQISKTFANPFDPRECDLNAIITTPSGKKVTIPAFFDETCERREATPGGDEIIEPTGEEFFTVRYRCAEEGPHSVVLELREGGKYTVVEKRWQTDDRFTPTGEAQPGQGRMWTRTWYANRYDDGKRAIEKIKFEPGPVTATLSLPPPAFTVTAGARPGARPFHGFIRAAADHRHFEFDDKTFFYPIGPCLRSPSDTRVPYRSNKWNAQFIDRIGKRGTYQYDDYLTEFGKNGITWARIWLCSWSGALEWRRDWPGYQGFARYNLLNAWRFDHIVEMAEKNGVALSVCLTNHGQFSIVVDSEWKNNPYNARLGGPLIAASEFFTRADAKIAHENKLRYIAARYGHSPAIMDWGLFSECEFTEEYEISITGGPDNPAPNVAAWHTEMSNFLKSVDPNKHLVLTHFSHPMRGTQILMLPAVDIATSNAYSAFEELAGGNTDASAALADYWAGNRYLPGFKTFFKPALVEEQGRHWMGMENGQTRDQLDADLHAGLWGSMVQPLAGATGYWWWLHVHFDNRYGDYKALAKFMEGEDFRPLPGEAPLEPIYRSVESPNKVLLGRALKSDRRFYVWVYHVNTPQSNTPLPAVIGGVLRLSTLRPGNYEVEFWDTYEGKIIEQHDVTIPPAPANGKQQPVPLKLPPVVRDLAIKVKPVSSVPSAPPVPSVLSPK